MSLKRWSLTVLGLVIIFSGPGLGEIVQCYALAFQTSGPWRSIICEPVVSVDLKYVAPIQILGALVCYSAVRRSKPHW